MKNKGLHTHRFADNPEEKHFAEAWDELNENKTYGTHLAWLLHTGDQGGLTIPREPTDIEKTVAATVIQWLGSPVGHGFLASLGYKKSEKKP